MDEQLKVLRPCPFCKSDHTDQWTWFGRLEDGRWMLQHFCYPKTEGLHISIAVYGDSPIECIERWNADGKKHNAE